MMAFVMWRHLKGVPSRTMPPRLRFPILRRDGKRHGSGTASAATVGESQGVPSRTMPPRLRFPLLRRDGKRHGSGTASAATVGESQGNIWLPGATVATLLMLGTLHARRLYEDKKIEEARQRGIEPEFAPDAKAAFLQLLPLRLISRAFGMMASLEIPVWARPYVYRGYCRAFHANLDEVAGDLANYTCLRDFFARTLKEGSRPLESALTCLLSPVDGIVLRYGQVRGPGAVIEQVKGFSFSLKSLLGAEPPDFSSTMSKSLMLEDTANEEVKGQTQQGRPQQEVGLCTPNVHPIASELPVNGLFYCVLYLGPGDYHRVHSPTDWHVFCRRHFSGGLFPVNERATRTIRDLYVVNERVVLEGKWSQGYMALVAVGATNVGSIELKFEPDLKTNRARPVSLTSGSPNVRVYGEKGSGLFIERGQEVAIFNLGSTVVLVFQAPASVAGQDDGNGLDQQLEAPGFSFRVKRGERVKMGQAIGKWQD